MKKFLWGLAVVAAICILLLVYWGLIHPLCWTLLPPKSYKGISYFQDEKYLQFEGSEHFQGLMDDYDIQQWDGEIADFAYYNNWKGDNPIYGRMCDVFLVTVIMQNESQYLAKKEQIIADTESNTGELDVDHIHYYQDTRNDIPFLWCINDENFSIELIYITETEHKTYDASRLLDILIKCTDKR